MSHTRKTPGAFKNVEPWPAEVEGETLLDDLVQVLRRHLVLPEGGVEATALWIAHTYALDATSVSPLLAIVSPVRGCGKTTFLTLLHALSPRSVLASNFSAAVLYRAVDRYSPTVLIDEADTFLADKEDLRGILNSGHFRAGAHVMRCDGNQYEPRIFSTWCAKAIAKIGRLPPTLADRSIHIRMRKRKPGEAIKPLRLDRIHAEMKPLRRKTRRWVDDHLAKLSEADPVLLAGIADRQADNWRPLLAIADEAGGQWPDRARCAAASLLGISDDSDEEASIRLLSDIRDLFDETGEPKLSSKQIVSWLIGLDGRPWAHWRNGEPVTASIVAVLLRDFEIHPKPLWIDGSTKQGYERDFFEEAWDRYVRRSRTVAEPQETQDNRADSVKSRNPPQVLGNLGSADPTPPSNSRADGNSDGTGYSPQGGEGLGGNANGLCLDCKQPMWPGYGLCVSCLGQEVSHV